jgi:hypothetical protein
MLEPGSRTVFYEMLRPPEGYHLEEGIATTYTLDLITLLTAPLAFTTFEWADAEGKPTSDPVLLLEALRRNADRLTVFCQVGRACAPAQQSILYSYLESMVVEVTAPLGGVFHPKLWLLRFEADDRPPIMRLVVLSRNVTGDRSWDLSLVLDGEVRDRQKGFSAHASFCEFIQALPGLAVRTPASAVVERATRLAELARRADFMPPEGFDEYELIPLGLKKRRGLPFMDNRKRMLVVAPFVTSGFLDDLAGDSTGHLLVSRSEELAKLPKAALAPFDQVYVLNDAANPEDDARPSPTSDDPLTGLHAKLFHIDGGWESVLYLGSPNATGPAFRKNVELLVGLHGKKSKIGIDQIMGRNEGQAGFLDLLIRFVPPDQPIQDTVEEALERELDALRLKLGTAGLFASVTDRDDQFLVRVRGLDRVALSPSAAVTMWPLAVPENANAQTLAPDTAELSFGPYPLAAITSFFGLAARVTLDGRSLEARFVLNLPLENPPKGRREAILGALLDDPEKFLRFLQFLLGDLDDLGPLPSGADRAAESSFGSWGAGDFVPLESLLQALKDDPQRLDYVHSTVTELISMENGTQRLPPGFLSVWEPIWAARQELPR